MKKIAIITARGGSKRIPKKNIKEFCGKPIISYSIKAALQSDCFDEVMVSTDSKEIADISLREGANVPFLRGKESSNDFATTSDVIQEVLAEYEKQGRGFDVFCCLYPTAPFITAEKLKEAMNTLESKNADSVIPIVQYGFPPQRAFVLKDDRVAYQYPEYEFARSQDLETIYHDCGQFYMCRTDVFKQFKTLILPKTFPIIMREEEVQDIDNLSDWNIAELKYQQFIK